MELKWLGHASWKLTTQGVVAYIDPYEGEMNEKADLVIASHSHSDHCKPDAVKPVLKPGTVIIAPADCAQKIGVNVRSLRPGEKTRIGTIEIEAVEAYNTKRFRSPGVPFHPKGLGVGYLIRTEGKTIYTTGDTEFVSELRGLKDIDVMLTVTGGMYTMDNDEAAELTLSIKPKVAIPMHMWDTDPKIYKKKVEAAGVTKVLIMKPGEAYKV